MEKLRVGDLATAAALVPCRIIEIRWVAESGRVGFGSWMIDVRFCESGEIVKGLSPWSVVPWMCWHDEGISPYQVEDGVHCPEWCYYTGTNHFLKSHKGTLQDRDRLKASAPIA